MEPDDFDSLKSSTLIRPVWMRASASQYFLLYLGTVGPWKV